MPRAHVEVDERPRPTLRLTSVGGLWTDPSLRGLVHRIVGYLEEQTKRLTWKVGYELSEARIWIELPTGHPDERQNAVALLERVAARLNAADEEQRR